jgi:hypothetical protein
MAYCLAQPCHRQNLLWTIKWGKRPALNTPDRVFLNISDPSCGKKHGDLQQALKSPTGRPLTRRTIHNSTALFGQDLWLRVDCIKLKGAFAFFMGSPWPATIMIGMPLAPPGASHTGLCLPNPR